MLSKRQHTQKCTSKSRKEIYINWFSLKSYYKQINKSAKIKHMSLPWEKSQQRDQEVIPDGHQASTTCRLMCERSSNNGQNGCSSQHVQEHHKEYTSSLPPAKIQIEEYHLRSHAKIFKNATKNERTSYGT